MNKEFISVLTYLTLFVLFLMKTFVDDVTLVDTNRIIKGPAPESGGFIRLVVIWLLITVNPDTNWM